MLTLRQASGASRVTGTDSHGATLTGTLSGRVFTYVSKQGSYTATFTVTIAPDGRSWSGPASDSNGTAGIDTATR